MSMNKVYEYELSPFTYYAAGFWPFWVL